MMDDRTLTRLEDRIIRTLNAKAAQVDQVDGLTLGTSSAARQTGHRGHRSRRAVSVFAIVLALGVAGATVAVADNPFSVGSGIDGVPSAQQAAQLAREKKDYDPAEIRYLLNQVGGASHTNDQELVGILEFRRACRETLRAVDAARSASAGGIARTVDRIMNPELQRLVDRETSQSQAAHMFGTLSAEIKQGSYASVLDWLDGPRGNCKDALKWHG